MNPKELDKVIGIVSSSFENNKLHKIKLSGATDQSKILKSLTLKPVTIKQERKLQLVYSYPTQDKTKNQSLAEVLDNFEDLLGQFENLSIVTSSHVYQMNKKVGKLFKSRNQNQEQKLPSHDRAKNHLVAKDSKYLKLLGVTNSSGNIAAGKSNKFRQINKYVEIMNSLIQQSGLAQDFSVLDVGSGKGYLTFSLYQHLVNNVKGNIQVRGIELRTELVNKCNEIAKECDYNKLSFEEGDISQLESEAADVLVALHACDTATDDAIAIGIKSKSKLIVCSPCCHKQIRSQMQNDIKHSILTKYGILKERQAEIVTDLIRSLLLEYHGYKTKVMEFISTEHTAKNLLIVGVLQTKKVDQEKITAEIEALKSEFGIEYHYLEKALAK